MRTVRCSERRGGGGCTSPGAYLPGGVPAWGVYLPRGVLAWGRVPAQGCTCLPEGASQHALRPPREQND